MSFSNDLKSVFKESGSKWEWFAKTVLNKVAKPLLEEDATFEIR